MCTVVENQQHGFTMLDSGYQTVTLFSVYDCIRVSNVAILQDVCREYWPLCQPYIQEPIVLERYATMITFIESLTESSFKVIQFKLLQALQAFKQ